MEKCKYCNTTEKIVHSGVDGILLGCLEDLYNICYDCGNKKAQKNLEKNNG